MKSIAMRAQRFCVSSRGELRGLQVRSRSNLARRLPFLQTSEIGAAVMGDS